MLSVALTQDAFWVPTAVISQRSRCREQHPAWCAHKFAAERRCSLQEEADWATAKRVLGQPKFIERLMAYDADNIPDAVLEALQRVVADARFTADQVRPFVNNERHQHWCGPRCMHKPTCCLHMCSGTMLSHQSTVHSST